MFLIAGGPGSDLTGVLREAMGETGKRSPAVAYIGTANGESEAFLIRMREILLAAGAGRVDPVRLLDRKGCPEDAKGILRSADAVFLSGGEVEDGMRGLSDEVRALLHTLYDDGTVFIGASAGTIMLGAAWPHWDDEEGHPEDAELFGCLGFVPVLFDTHCEWEDWVELRKAVSLSPEGATGYGIPTGAYLIAEPDGRLIPSAKPFLCRSAGGEAVPV